MIWFSCAEMHWLLSSLRAFAAAPDKVLVWRETSAQHHIAEGGEYTFNAAGEKRDTRRRKEPGRSMIA
jgi:hypothetical protein